MRTTVWFVRAGQSVANQHRRFQGQSNSGLTTLGIAQMQQAAAELRRQKISSIYSAPQQGTHESAAYIAASQRLLPQWDGAWADQNLGRLTGLTRHEAQKQFPVEMALRVQNPVHGAAPDAESVSDVSRRCIVAWDGLLRRHRGQRVVVVTQALPIQMILCAVLGTPLAQAWSWRMDNGGLTCFDFYGQTAIVRCINATVSLQRADIDAATGSLPPNPEASFT